MPTPPVARWSIIKHEPSVMTLELPAKGGVVLQISDIHWDNRHCDRAALKRDLDEAIERDAAIVMIGDTFCAMQGKWDPRKDQTQLRPEHAGGKYFDLLVDSAVEWFKPYAKNIALITYGNHETSILSRQQTDLVQRLRDGLRHAGSPAEVGSYAGFLKVRAPVHSSCIHRVICWNHGNGGGGEVTRGMIDNNRIRGMAEADIYIGGHIHRRNADENVKIELDASNMKLRKKHQWFLRSSTYKNESGIHDQDMSGYHIERRGPGERPVGGWWWEFSPIIIDQRRDNIRRRSYELRFRPTPTWA